MAYWSIPSSQQIDYSANGDDIDSFSQKVDWCLKEIFNSLQYLHSNGATEDINTPAQAYEIRIDSDTNELCIRNPTNDDWIRLGKLEEHFGIKPSDIGAITNGDGKIGRIFMGNLAIDELPVAPDETYKANDLYFSTKKKALYCYTGSSWFVFLTSGDGGEILTTSKLAMVGSASNAGKILTINANGKLDTDITGSAEKIFGKLIIKEGTLSDRQVLMYSPTGNGGTGAFVNKNVDAIVGGGGGLTGEYLTITQGNTTLGTYNGSTAQTIAIPTVPSATTNQKYLTITQGNATLGTYNGEEAKIIAIPTIPSTTTNQKLTIKSGNTILGEYDGTTAKSVDVKPADNKSLVIKKTGSPDVRYNGTIEMEISLPTTNRQLTLKYGEESLGTYNGEEAKTIVIPTVDTSLAPLTFWNGTTTIDTYDGKTEKDINIAQNLQNLTFTQGDSIVGSYNGMSTLGVNLPTPNKKLTITNGNSILVDYDGKVAQTLNAQIISSSEVQLLADLKEIKGIKRVVSNICKYLNDNNTIQLPVYSFSPFRYFDFKNGNNISLSISSVTTDENGVLLQANTGGSVNTIISTEQIYFPTPGHWRKIYLIITHDTQLVNNINYVGVAIIAGDKATGEPAWVGDDSYVQDKTFFTMTRDFWGGSQVAYSYVTANDNLYGHGFYFKIRYSGNSTANDLHVYSMSVWADE